jgi:hypothetical protein
MTQTEHGEVACFPPSPPASDARPWSLMLACLGHRIDAPHVLQWLASIGAKPLRRVSQKNALMGGSTRSQPTGIEVGANINPKHRALWPPCQEGNTWVTYVTNISLKPNSSERVPLPEGWSWARFPGDYNGPRWVRLELDDHAIAILWRNLKGEGTERIGLFLREETDYISVNPFAEETSPLQHVEGAFFATWGALNGLLNLQRYAADVLHHWRERTATPLAFLTGPCQGIVWDSDIRPEYIDFMNHYYKGFDVPDSERWVTDIKAVFGGANHFRKADEPMTPDDWASYDRIAPHIAQRFAAWRKGGGG